MDLYLNTRRDLLVVKKGCPIPLVAALGKRRKSKKRVLKVSEEISSALPCALPRYEPLHRETLRRAALTRLA
jgi:hypothetical protein